jgi:hypothetical protein
MKKKTIVITAAMVSSLLFSGCGMFNKANNMVKKADAGSTETVSDDSFISESDTNDEMETESDEESDDSLEGFDDTNTDGESEDYDAENSENEEYSGSDSGSAADYYHNYIAKDAATNVKTGVKTDSEGNMHLNGYVLRNVERESLPESAIVGAPSINIYQDVTKESETDSANENTENTSDTTVQEKDTFTSETVARPRETVAETKAPVPVQKPVETTAAPKPQETKPKDEETAKTALPGESETHEVVPYAVQNSFSSTDLIQDMPSEQ